MPSLLRDMRDQELRAYVVSHSLMTKAESQGVDPALCFGALAVIVMDLNPEVGAQALDAVDAWLDAQRKA